MHRSPPLLLLACCFCVGALGCAGEVELSSGDSTPPVVLLPENEEMGPSSDDMGAGPAPSNNMTPSSNTGTPPAPSAVCGDGVVQGDEVCDGNCPMGCDDGDACTTNQVVSGAAATCDLLCQWDPVTSCQSGDGCCPQGCTQANDSDCDAICGDGVVQSDEVCDGNCPAGCDDGDACTTNRVVSGSAATCDLQCQWDPVTSCQSGDGCCPQGCSPDQDSDCIVDCNDTSAWSTRDAQLEDEVLVLVNEERAAGATCGGQSFPSVPPLVMDEELRKAARCHSQDMDETGNFSHTGTDGSSFSTRIGRTNFAGAPVSENIASGSSSASSVVGLWMNSTGHCRNIMSSSPNAIGVGKAGRYWTQVFGRR